MTVVSNVELRPDGTPKRGGKVKVGIVNVGWRGDGSMVIDVSDPKLTDDQGFVSFDLLPSPAGTWYVWNHSDGITQSTFILPSSGGPYTVQGLLVTSPSAAADPAVTQAAIAGYVTGQTTGLVPRGEIALSSDSEWGIHHDGDEQDSAALDNFITEALATGKLPYLGAGVIALNGETAASVSAPQHGLYALNPGRTTLDFSAFTGPTCIAVSGVGDSDLDDSYQHRAVLHKISGLRIIGPDTDGAEVDCIVFDDSLSLDAFTLESLLIFGFRDGESILNNTWLIERHNVQIAHCHRRGRNYSALTNAGENIRSFGGSVQACRNAGSTAVGLYIDPEHNLSVYDYGVSYDYNDIHLDHRGAFYHMIGGHWENGDNGASPDNRPMGFYRYTSGRPTTSALFTGVDFGPSEDPPTARKHLHELVSGDRIDVLVRDPKVVSFGLRLDMGHIVSGKGRFTVEGRVRIETDVAPNIARQGLPCNLFTNQRFDTGDFSGWRINGGGYGFTVQTQSADPYSGATHYVQITGSLSGTTGWYYQRFGCQPRTKFIVTTEIDATSMTAGTAGPLILAFGHNDQFLGQSAFTAATAGAARAMYGGEYDAPEGTAYVEVRPVYVTAATTGTINVYEPYVDADSPVNGIPIPIGTTANTIAAGNDSRITGAEQAANKGAASGYAELDSATKLPILRAPVKGPPPPKTGQWQPPSNMAGTTATALSGTSGQGSFCYFDVVQPVTIAALGVFVSVAAVGGTSLELRLGLFADDGSLSYPGALIVDGGAATINGSTGQVQGSTISQALTPGRYWVGAKWTFGTVPTTLPQLLFINSASPPLPGANVGNNRGYPTTGLSSGAFSGSAPAGMFASGATTIICAGIKAA